MIEVRDVRGNLLEPGDKVIYADVYSDNPGRHTQWGTGLGLSFGVIDGHVTESGKLRIKRDGCYQYRYPGQLLKEI